MISRILLTLLMAIALLVQGCTQDVEDEVRVATDLSMQTGVLHYPDPQLYPNPHIAVISIHRVSNFLMHYSSLELSRRGFVALGMNTRCPSCL